MSRLDLARSVALHLASHRLTLQCELAQLRLPWFWIKNKSRFNFFSSNQNPKPEKFWCRASLFLICLQSVNFVNIDWIFTDDSIVCYGMYGCFSKENPWTNNRTRPVAEFPAHPSAINPTFCLRTRYNPKECQILDYTNRSSIFRSYYTPLHKTYFVVHGFLDNGEKSWILVRNYRNFSST